MAYVMPEIVMQKIIAYGIKQLRSDKTAFLDIFSQLTQDELSSDYGPAYLEQIWNWFSTTKIPVVKAWQFNTQIIPCVSVHLANETEDESKASIGDYMGTFDENGETNIGVFTVMVDIGIHANKAGDHVLWLYYIVNYILFKHKLMANRLGLKLHTFSASDYSKDANKVTENIWTRWVRFRCTTQNFLGGAPSIEIADLNLDPAVGLEPASDIAASDDVEWPIDPTVNTGLQASSSEDEDDSDGTNI